MREAIIVPAALPTSRNAGILGVAESARGSFVAVLESARMAYIALPGSPLGLSCSAHHGLCCSLQTWPLSLNFIPFCLFFALVALHWTGVQCRVR